MRIAIVQHVDAGYYSDYISSLIDEAAINSGYQVKTWSNSVPVFNQHIAENAVIYILVESSASFTLRWWYAVKLPSILKKLKAAVVLDLNGVSSSAKIPQLITLDQTIQAEKESSSISRFTDNHFLHSLNHVQSAIIYSENKANSLTKNDAIKNKLQVVRFTAPENFRKFKWHEKIMIKAMQAENNDYFLSILNDNAEHDFTLVLRAFSIFKKWQQSAMKLLLLPKYEAFEPSIHEKLKTYKYRDDVKLVEGIKETDLVSVIASAHSFIHVTFGFADLMVLSIASKCALPVITNKNADVEEYLSSAAVYIHDVSAEFLGEALINIYKDENLHAQLKEDAEKRAMFLNREEYKSKLWQLLQNMANSKN